MEEHDFTDPHSRLMRNLPRGAIIATAELVECWEIKNLHRFLGDNDLQLVAANGEYKSLADNCAKELNFGDFSLGRFALELRDVQRLPEPIPVRGQQGLWEWDDSALIPAARKSEQETAYGGLAPAT